MTDTEAMQLALAQAQLAADAGEVPVGAVVVHQGRVVGVGRNAPIGQHDPTAHAEIAALRMAAAALGNYRLDGCALFVTLEPCSMCSGAMLHARLARVVYGAADPKTGAAGSVLDLFAQPQLNHQTRVTAGVLRDACAALLQRFFQQRRAHARNVATGQSLRDDAVRTPEQRFADLPGYPWPGRYVHDLPSLAGLRMHYLDEAGGGETVSPKTFLCLHGNPAWSYVYRKMLPVWTAAGHRVVAPDLIGFGKSDKPKRESAHTFAWHRQVLLEFIERLDLREIVLVVQDWGGLLGLTLPMAAPERYRGLLAMNTLLGTGEALPAGFLAWRDWCQRSPGYDVARLLQRGCPDMPAQDAAAYAAPFPDAGHRAALRVFPELVPDGPDAPGAEISRAARRFWAEQWSGATLVAVGTRDPVLGLPVMQALADGIRACPPLLQLAGAGHFVPEWGEPLARHALTVL